MVWPSEPSGGDQFVMDDLDHHLAGRDRLDDGGADRLLAHALGETADDVERDVGFQQRAAHLAHRGVDVGFRTARRARVSRSRMPPSFSDRLSNNAVVLCACCRRFAAFAAAVIIPPWCAGVARRGDDDLGVPWQRQDDRPNTFAPEGASRCRALTSGLKGAGRRVEKNVFFEKVAGLNPLSGGKSRKSRAA